MIEAMFAGTFLVFGPIVLLLLFSSVKEGIQDKKSGPAWVKILFVLFFIVLGVLQFGFHR